MFGAHALLRAPDAALQEAPDADPFAPSFVATASGGFVLSENGLYTREGWRAFVDRLAPGGLFTVSRWYAPGDVNLGQFNDQFRRMMVSKTVLLRNART